MLSKKVITVEGTTFVINSYSGKVAKRESIERQHLSGGGGQSFSYKGTGGGYVDEIKTTHTTTENYWLTDDDGNEKQLTLESWDFKAREGNDVTFSYFGKQGDSSLKLLAVKNHSTGSWIYSKENLASIGIPKNIYGLIGLIFLVAVFFDISLFYINKRGHNDIEFAFILSLVASIFSALAFSFKNKKSKQINKILETVGLNGEEKIANKKLILITALPLAIFTGFYFTKNFDYPIRSEIDWSKYPNPQEKSAVEIVRARENKSQSHVESKAAAKTEYVPPTPPEIKSVQPDKAPTEAEKYFQALKTKVGLSKPSTLQEGKGRYLDYCRLAECRSKLKSLEIDASARLQEVLNVGEINGLVIDVEEASCSNMHMVGLKLSTPFYCSARFSAKLAQEQVFDRENAKIGYFLSVNGSSYDFVYAGVEISDRRIK